MTPFIRRILLLVLLLIIAFASNAAGQDLKKVEPKLEPPAHTISGVHYVERNIYMSRSSPTSNYYVHQRPLFDSYQVMVWDFELDGKSDIVRVVLTWSNEEPDDVTVHGLSPSKGGVTYESYEPTDYHLGTTSRFWYFRIAPEYQDTAKSQIEGLFEKNIGRRTIPNLTFE